MREPAPSGAFTRYDLRTTDVPGASEFYRAVAGLREESHGGVATLFAGEIRVGALAPLPERARAGGAPAHWLGRVSVPDVASTLDRLVERGGQQLGPWQEDSEGRRFATVRDPQGAVFAIGPTDSAPDSIGDTVPGSAPPVGWHQLHTTHREAAWDLYSELFGWRELPMMDPGPEIDTFRTFTWSGSERSVGGMSDTARAPGIHTHWLFHLTVPNLDGALETASALGATVVHEPIELPGGDRVVACDDPQGAAFALIQRGA